MLIEDTIVALSSAAGPGARAVVRLSGPAAFAVTSSVFVDSLPPQRRRQHVDGKVRFSGIAPPLPADLYLWPGPRSYTGQDVAELHTLSCPPLLDILIADLLRAGARAAQPGEFTLRAFLAGKLDLPRAEAVLGVIEANDRDQLRQALTQLAGGLTQPLHALREDLLNLLADLEAGLDFADEDIHFIQSEDLLARLAKGMAQLKTLERQLEDRALSGRPFRAVLVGRPNAGKSSLFNALGGQALVSDQPGTTRDYVSQRLDLDGHAIELIDTAGRQEADEAIAEQAQTLGHSQAEAADLILVCVPANQPVNAEEEAMRTRPEAVAIATQCDRAPAFPGWLPTSATTGAGLDALRALLTDRARRHAQPPLAPSLSRCRHHVESCTRHLRRAHEMVLYEDPPELLALELRDALEQLGEMAGAIYTDDLLDRIFSRFCIGK